MKNKTNNSLQSWKASLADSALLCSQLAHAVPAWAVGRGKHSDIVLSTRIRLARNLVEHSFPNAANREVLREVSEEICEAIAGLNLLPGARYLDMRQLSQLDRQVLVERRLSSPAFAEKKHPAALVFDSSEFISLMINEEDHLRMQSFQPGCGIREAWRALQALDQRLSERLAYAFTERFGYLTSCPTNTGTGMRVSILIHLPALAMINEIDDLAKRFKNFGIIMRGFYGEGSDAIGNLFQISNQITLGRPEHHLLELLEDVAVKLVELEQIARKELLAKQRAKVEDRVWRTYGVLRYARRLSSNEVIDFLSAMRLGVDLRLLSGWPPELLNELMLVTQPGHLRKNHSDMRAAGSRDRLRAQIVQQKLGLRDG